MKTAGPTIAWTLIFIGIVLRLLDGGGGVPFVPSEKLIDVDGPAVLVVYESSDIPIYPKEMQATIYGAKWAELLPPENFRILDKDVKFTGESPFKAAFDRPRDSLPWCIIQGSRVYEGPLPGNPDEMKMKVEGLL